MGDRTSSERNRRYRNNVKLSNSTDGQSAIDPRTYKKDIPTQAWMDSRYLATLSEWLDQGKDIYDRTRTLSEVMQEGIRVLVDHLVRCNEVDMIDDPSIAQKMLVMKYKIKIRKGYGARGKQNFIHNQVLTERRREVAGSIEREDRSRDIRERPVYETHIDVIPEEEKGKIDEMVRIYNELEQKDIKKETERQKANAMKSGRVVMVENEPVNEDLDEKHEKMARQRDQEIAENDMMPPGYEK